MLLARLQVSDFQNLELSNEKEREGKSWRKTNEYKESNHNHICL